MLGKQSNDPPPVSPQIPMGLSAAASVRVGNALGGGRPEQAKLSCKVPVFCTCKSPPDRLDHTRYSKDTLTKTL